MMSSPHPDTISSKIFSISNARASLSSVSSWNVCYPHACLIVQTAADITSLSGLFIRNRAFFGSTIL